MDVGEEQRREIRQHQQRGGEDVGENHAANVVAGFAEIGEAADRAFREEFVGPADEDAAFVAVRAAAAQGVAEGLRKGWTREHGPIVAGIGAGVGARGTGPGGEADECYDEMNGWLLRCGDGGIPDSFGSCVGIRLAKEAGYEAI